MNLSEEDLNARLDALESTIEYLKLALKEKLGDVSDLCLTEDSVKLSEIRKDFPRQNFRVQKLSWKMQLKMLKMYARLTGDIIPPILWEKSTGETARTE